MSGRGRKTQPTSQRLNKNRSSLGGASRSSASSKNQNASKNLRFGFSDSFSKKNPVKMEVEELKQEVYDLKKLTQENNYILLQSKVDKLELENKRLRYNNSKRSKFPVDDDEDDWDLEDEDDSIRSAKRQMRNKPSDEERAKVLMKTLLKTFPELELKEHETFKSEANVEICRKLIPKLQKEMKAYSPSYEQVETWLQSIHRSKRNAYLKSNQSNHTGFDFFLPGLVGSYPESNRSNQSTAKRQTKPKGSKANNIFEDEVEEGAKSLMKALLKTYPYDLTLRIEDTFRSQINTNVCERLIPKLQEDVRPAYNLSYDQVESWLQTFHKNKRTAYLKSDFMTVDYY
ncbi:unnamed protein product [Rhizophagus irregularis]|uniref:Uncharacterized protein n=1 Tax=Rhizophagus irregularis TaxID=588596 RepID=A0A2I1FY15_9GLOM|nr:hypothetical protein RhiirA4_452435 [Rhizophagus irregularis]CAB4427864.1 unnamed protein product [Rhizophagus irregularis]